MNEMDFNRLREDLKKDKNLRRELQLLRVKSKGQKKVILNLLLTESNDKI